MTVELKGMNVSRERAAETFNGYVMLLVALVLSALALSLARPVSVRLPAGTDCRREAAAPLETRAVHSACLHIDDIDEAARLQPRMR